MTSETCIIVLTERDIKYFKCKAMDVNTIRLQPKLRDSELNGDDGSDYFYRGRGKHFHYLHRILNLTRMIT